MANSLCCRQRCKQPGSDALLAEEIPAADEPSPGPRGFISLLLLPLPAVPLDTVPGLQRGQAGGRGVVNLHFYQVFS